MSKSETLEVMAKQVKSDTVSVLGMYAKQVHDEYAAFQSLETEATWRALKIGALLVMVKEQLPHGQFGRWAEQNLPYINDRTCRRFMALAEKFRKDRSLGYDSIKLISDVVDPAKPEKGSKQYVQMVMDFIGDKSLTDLYIEHDIIKRDLKVRGGARQNTHPVRSPSEQVQHNIDLARSHWIAAAQAMKDLTENDSIKLLADDVLLLAHSNIAAGYHALSKEIKTRKVG